MDGIYDTVSKIKNGGDKMKKVLKIFGIFIGVALIFSVIASIIGGDTSPSESSLSIEGVVLVYDIDIRDDNTPVELTIKNNYEEVVLVNDFEIVLRIDADPEWEVDCQTSEGQSIEPGQELTIRYTCNDVSIEDYTIVLIEEDKQELLSIVPNYDYAKYIEIVDYYGEVDGNTAGFAFEIKNTGELTLWSPYISFFLVDVIGQETVGYWDVDGLIQVEPGDTAIFVYWFDVSDMFEIDSYGRRDWD